MSARLQQCPERQHDLADDLEAFMHVLNYCALKHLPDAASTEAESAYLTQYLYNAVVPADTPYSKGSPLKLEKVQNGTPFVNGLPPQHPLAGLLAELSQLCKQHYEHVVLPESRSFSPRNVFARGSYCGAKEMLPDYDGDLDDDSPDELDGRSTPLHALSSHNIAPSPLRTHDKMVGACMKAIRKVWPVVDRRERPIRARPLARRESRLDTKRTWSESDICDEGEDTRKRARKDSGAHVPVRSGSSTSGLQRRRSSK